MIRFLWMASLALLVLSSCNSLKSTTSIAALPTTATQQPTAETEQPAAAQTSTTETTVPASAEVAEFRAAEALKNLETAKATKPDGLASTNRKMLSPELRKPLGLSKAVLKIAEKQVVKAVKKRRPAQQDGTILGLSPVLFFALVAVLVGVILLFVAGKSQFFSILTVVLLVGGLLVALAAFLNLI